MGQRVGARRSSGSGGGRRRQRWSSQPAPDMPCCLPQPPDRCTAGRQRRWRCARRSPAGPPLRQLGAAAVAPAWSQAGPGAPAAALGEPRSAPGGPQAASGERAATCGRTGCSSASSDHQAARSSAGSVSGAASPCVFAAAGAHSRLLERMAGPPCSCASSTCCGHCQITCRRVGARSACSAALDSSFIERGAASTRLPACPASPASPASPACDAAAGQAARETGRACLPRRRPTRRPPCTVVTFPLLQAVTSVHPASSHGGAVCQAAARGGAGRQWGCPRRGGHHFPPAQQECGGAGAFG